MLATTLPTPGLVEALIGLALTWLPFVVIVVVFAWLQARAAKVQRELVARSRQHMDRIEGQLQRLIELAEQRGVGK